MLQGRRSPPDIEGRSGAELGDILDAAPHTGLAGRIRHQARFDPTPRRSKRCHYRGPRRPSFPRCQVIASRQAARRSLANLTFVSNHRLAKSWPVA